jgi:hypothetical protein
MASNKQQEAKEIVSGLVNTAMALSVEDMAADAGGGFEDASKDSYAIPFIQLLQKGSPPIDPDHPKHKEIPGAKIGSLYNTVTEAVADGDKGLLVLPCHFQQSYIEWADRDAGGGFVAQHDVPTGVNMLATCKRDDKNRDVLPNGNYLVDTRNHYVLVINEDGSAHPAVISMASTQTKKSKKWMSAMQDVKVKRADGEVFTPPMWAKAYRVKSIAESNAKGTWRGWDITRESDCPSAGLYQQAKAFRDAVRAGKVKTVDPAVREPGSDDDIEM